MHDHAQLVDFYDESYSGQGADAQLYARWRALGARGKADHVTQLCGRARLRPASTLDVGCGDGALLCELHRRDFGGSLHGVEITRAAVEIAERRTEIDSVKLYDGQHLNDADGAHELGILSHVLEHVLDPVALLAEVARVCGAVIVEVPLEQNLSARRASKRRHAEEVGHLRRLDRDAARKIATDAGLQIVGELEDALPLRVQRFFATGLTAQSAACAKWGLRTGLHTLAPGVAKRLLTVHYAYLCAAAPIR